MNPITNIDDTKKAIEAHTGSVEDFKLPLSEELFDPVGINMAIITDSILARGWEPNGFVQKDGYRICLFKEAQ